MSSLFNNRLLKLGLPFFVFVIAGSIGLREFTALKYEYKNTNNYIREEALKSGIPMKKPGEVSLEGEYEKYKNIDIEKWENKRIPRPWEEPETK